MRIMTSLMVGLLVSVPVATHTTAWENLAKSLGVEFLRDHVNVAAKTAINQDKIKVGEFTLTDAGDVTEYALAAASKENHDAIIARAIVNTLYHIVVSPVLERVVDQDSLRRTELFIRAAAKLAIQTFVLPHITK